MLVLFTEGEVAGVDTAGATETVGGGGEEIACGRGDPVAAGAGVTAAPVGLGLTGFDTALPGGSDACGTADGATAADAAEVPIAAGTSEPPGDGTGNAEDVALAPEADGPRAGSLMVAAVPSVERVYRHAARPLPANTSTASAAPMMTPVRLGSDCCRAPVVPQAWPV